MPIDFRATQIQTKHLIASGSFAGTGEGSQIIITRIEDDSQTSPNQGAIENSELLEQIEQSDVFLFVSGAVGGKNQNSRGITVFGGDVHISGSLSGPIISSRLVTTTSDTILPSDHGGSVTTIDLGNPIDLDFPDTLPVGFEVTVLRSAPGAPEDDPGNPVNFTGSGGSDPHIFLPVDFIEKTYEVAKIKKIFDPSMGMGLPYAWSVSIGVVPEETSGTSNVLFEWNGEDLSQFVDSTDLSVDASTVDPTRNAIRWSPATISVNEARFFDFELPDTYVISAEVARPNSVSQTSGVGAGQDASRWMGFGTYGASAVRWIARDAEGVHNHGSTPAAYIPIVNSYYYGRVSIRVQHAPFNRTLWGADPHYTWLSNNVTAWRMETNGMFGAMGAGWEAAGPWRPGLVIQTAGASLGTNWEWLSFRVLTGES